MSVILLRLIPTAPRAASDFLTDLTGLEIKAYDLTVEDSQNGVDLGKAAFHKDENKTTIYQHFALQPGAIPPLAFYSVATAVIVAEPPTGHLEYDSFDLRLEIKRNGQSILDDTIEYNVNLFQPAKSPLDYFDLEPSAYFQLPPAPSQSLANAANVSLPSSGQPPVFATIRDAINIVLNQDHPTPGGTTPSNKSLETLSSPLTPGQASQIASEIIWNRSLKPAPTSTITLQGSLLSRIDLTLGTQNSMTPKDMYTIIPPTTTDSKGNIVPGSIPSGSPQDLARQQFEAALSGYRSNLTATSTKLANFVFAASAAVWCEQQTANAISAGITVPIDIAPDTVPPTFSDTPVLITQIESNAFIVPAAYFYVLGATYPTQISASQRYKSSLLTTENQLLSAFEAALNANSLSSTEAPVTPNQPGINLAQAARRITALGDTTGPLSPITYGTVKDLITGWLNYPDDSPSMDLNYWIGIPTTKPGAIDQYPLEYVTLLLEAITMDSTNTVDAILSQNGPLSSSSKNIQIQNIQQLVTVTPSQWETFFTANSGVLPPFTAPGSTPQRITTFLARLTKFLTPNADAATETSTSGGTIANYGTPPGDPLLGFISAYGNSFSFAQQPDPTLFNTALDSVFPSNTDYREWLKRAINTIVALYQVTSKITSNTDSSPISPNLQFSLMEALYARGFTSLEDISALSPDKFQSALAGSVAFAYATQIHNASPKVDTSSHASSKVSDEDFHPVNPDGELVNYIPPENLSPQGKIAYLHDLLGVKVGNSTLGDILARRRGPIGELLCTMDNLETPIPQIDLVNESLESLGSTSHGAVNNTIVPKLHEQDAAVLLSTVPQYSSPSSPPAPIYATLRKCFTASDLPYSQAEDISRSYLEALGTSRFDVMRHFRHDITEFAIDAAEEPADFQQNLWRYPVRLELALEYIHVSFKEYSQLFSGKSTDAEVLELLGYQVDDDKLFTVPGFLKASGLNYSELIKLWKCKFISFTSNLENGEFPADEPCCLKKLRLKFAATGDALASELHQLFVFIRLWRRLQEIHGPKISFEQLADISNVLKLFIENDVNGDFLRQLAALLLLRDHFGVPLTTHGKGLTLIVTTDFRYESCGKYTHPRGMGGSNRENTGMD